MAQPIPILPPVSVEQELEALNREVAADLARLSQEALRAYPSLMAESRMDARRKLRPVTEVIDRIRVQYAALFRQKEERISGQLQRIEERVRRENAEAWKSNIAQKVADSSLSVEARAFAIAMEPGIPTALSTAWTSQQLTLIKAIGTRRVPPIPYQHFQKLENLVQDAVHRGLRVEELRKQIVELDGVTRRRSEVIARDQVGKYNGRMTEIRHKEIGVKAYFWRTVGDERVRLQHAQRDGKRFYYSQPPAGGHPGQAVQCRCYADPDLESALRAIERKAVA